MARVLVNMPSQVGGKHSGVARVAFALLEQLLVRGGHEYVLRSNWTRNTLPDALRNSALEVITVQRPRVMIADVVRQLVTVPKLCRTHNVDLVWNIDIFGATWGAQARVTTLHDLYFNSVPELIGARAALTMRLCCRLVLSGSKRIVAISGRTRDEAVALFPALAERIDVIANDATLSPFAGNALREIAEPYLLVVGNGTPNKNFGVVPEALKRLPASHRPLLVHVGSDEGGHLDAAAQNNMMRLKRLSDIDDMRLAALYTHATALVVPSLSEGFCLPIIEAQGLGCPVIASDASVMPEVAGAAALYFDPRDPATLAACIAELLASPMVRTRLVTSGYSNRRRYSWAESAARYADLFDNLAGHMR